MTDLPGRLFGVLCLLLGVWIVTYWVYEPASPGVTVGSDPHLTETASPGFSTPIARPAGGSDGISLSSSRKEVVDDLVADAVAPAVGDRVPPEFIQYTVQQGDLGFDSIAKRLYGDAALGPVIARANPFVPAERLYAGRTILLVPRDPMNVRGRVVTSVGSDQREDVVAVVDPLVQTPVIEMGVSPGGSEKPTGPSADVEDTERVEYTIKRGDSLWKISDRFYGTGTRWRRIYDANRDVIKDPDRPPLGETIVIPPESSGE